MLYVIFTTEVITLFDLQTYAVNIHRYQLNKSFISNSKSPIFLQPSTPNLALSRFIVEVSESHTTIPVRLLRTSDQLVEEAAIYKHNQHNRRTSLTSPGFEPAILSIQRSQTYALEGTAFPTDINHYNHSCFISEVQTYTNVTNFETNVFDYTLLGYIIFLMYQHIIRI